MITAVLTVLLFRTVDGKATEPVGVIDYRHTVPRCTAHFLLMAPLFVLLRVASGTVHGVNFSNSGTVQRSWFAQPQRK